MARRPKTFFERTSTLCLIRSFTTARLPVRAARCSGVQSLRSRALTWAPLLNRTSDSETGQVGPQTAVLLDLPLVTSATSIEKIDSGLRVNRISDEFAETFETTLPAALTIHPTAVQPRDVSLMGIQQTFEQQSLEKLTLPSLGLTAEQVGDAGSGTRVLSMQRVSRKRTCDFIEGSVDEQADKLLENLLKLGLVG